MYRRPVFCAIAFQALYHKTITEQKQALPKKEMPAFE